MRVVMHAEICDECKCCTVTQGFICLSVIFGYSVFFIMFRNYYFRKIEIMFIDT
jgi:hypothetical protein